MSQHHFPQSHELEQKAIAALAVALQDRHPDPHTYVAARIFDLQPEEVNEDQRQFAKRLTYKNLYNNQPPQCRVFEPWINNRSGEPYTAVVRGRHRTTLVPMVTYLDENGMAWFGDVEDFEKKFTRAPSLRDRADLKELEVRIAAMPLPATGDEHGQGTQG